MALGSNSLRFFVTLSDFVFIVCGTLLMIGCGFTLFCLLFGIGTIATGIVGLAAIYKMERKLLTVFCILSALVCAGGVVFLIYLIYKDKISSVLDVIYQIIIILGGAFSAGISADLRSRKLPNDLAKILLDEEEKENARLDDDDLIDQHMPKLSVKIKKSKKSSKDKKSIQF
jgi:hypothetical protein